MPAQPRTHIVHLLYRFAAGGLENVIVQLINGLPRDRFRHTIIALTQADPAFIARIEPADVEVVQLHKAPGQPYRMYHAMYKLLRQLRPDVMHTCNLAALEFQAIAWAAGVPRRIHAEHGWDIADPSGQNKKYRLLRKLHQRFAHHIITVPHAGHFISQQLHDYMAGVIGIPAARLHLIRNGVEPNAFAHRAMATRDPKAFPSTDPDPSHSPPASLSISSSS